MSRLISTSNSDHESKKEKEEEKIDSTKNEIICSNTPESTPEITKPIFFEEKIEHNREAITASNLSGPTSSSSSSQPAHVSSVPLPLTAMYPPTWADINNSLPSHAYDGNSTTTLQPLEPQEMEQPVPPARPAKEPIVQSTLAEETTHSFFAHQCPGFAVCCNSCDATIPDAHYHCQTCDDGDFDLCSGCVEKGITCYGQDHWLIKRNICGGQIITSTTEKITPKPKPKPEPIVKKEPSQVDRPIPASSRSFTSLPIHQFSTKFSAIRTCNCCVQEYPENQFVHCQTCDDFDLCKNCFVKDTHGHHPAHAFEPVTPGDNPEPMVKARLAPGRNTSHKAICDGCDKSIMGVRHKCLDCPDWDYCSDCVLNAAFVHEGHRFVPIYGSVEPLNRERTIHTGICCDGPLCSSRRTKRYIKGIRYKCTVCHDTDFCADCEASPANSHNKTHPLIKFKTPVRHVTVTTTGDKGDGEPMPAMGDRICSSTSSRATSTVPNMSPSAIQTVVDVKPAEFSPAVLPIRPAPVAASVQTSKHEDLEAVYVSDTIADGTVMKPNHVFEQNWTVHNTGKFAWPAGCSVKFVSGDYMGHIDPSHPTSVRDLILANESTVCYHALKPGCEFTFSVLLRTPKRPGKVASYWRLTTPDGFHFGHRLWCDVEVENIQIAEETQLGKAEQKVEDKTEVSPVQSQMIFPKLEKESSVSSVHHEAKSEPYVAELSREAHETDFEELPEDDDDWAESVLTDDEYDLIDASDEEYCNMMEQKEAK